MRTQRGSRDRVIRRVLRSTFAIPVATNDVAGERYRPIGMVVPNGAGRKGCAGNTGVTGNGVSREPKVRYSRRDSATMVAAEVDPYGEYPSSYSLFPDRQGNFEGSGTLPLGQRGERSLFFG